MPATLEPPSILVQFGLDWPSLEQSLQELRREQEALGEFMQETLAAIDENRASLDDQHAAVREERAELAEARAELAQEKAALEAQKNGLDGGESQRVRELEQERLALETELETVRQRAADLTETLAEQKRQLAEERAEWTAEFRQLRKILDKQSQVLASRLEAVPVPLGVPGPALVAAGVPSAAGAMSSSDTVDRSIRDTVVGSVMSQFQLLQKDAARRRAQTKKC